MARDIQSGDLLGIFARIRASAWTRREAWDPDVTSLKMRLEKVLAGTANPELRGAIGDLTVEIADRALERYQNYRRGRNSWSAVNWVLGGVSVIASAVGGSVLVSNNLSGWARWIVGGASLLGGIVGGLTSMLNPAEEKATLQLKSYMYEAIWRESWHFALTQLPMMKLEDAERRLEELRQGLERIRLTTPHAVVPPSQVEPPPTSEATAAPSPEAKPPGN